MATIVKIDSNVTGLRYAEESSLKTLLGSEVWYPLEPNSYSDFGGKLTTIVRRPISQTRQQQKGTVTDLEASGGFESDLTASNMKRLLQGFLFADAYEKATSRPLNSAGVAMTAATTTTYTAASGLGEFKAGDMVFASGFSVAGNNGLKGPLSNASATTLTLTGLTAEASPPAAAKVECVGHQFASGDISIAMVGGLPRLTSAAFNFTTGIGGGKVQAGEWVYVGGDTAATQLASGKGFARINAVAATYLEFDKVDWAAADDAGTGKTVEVFWGNVYKNEGDPAKIKRRSYQLERTLGSDANGVMSEYLVGAVGNEMTFNVKTADKVTVNMSFKALDNEQRDGSTGVKAGTRPDIVPADAFNTSSDFSRIKLAKVDTTTAAPTALFAYCTDITLGIKNNVSGIKAIGTLGAFDTVAGMFTVDGKLTAYFADIAGVKAVRDNADITLDVAIVKNNYGMVIDLPLITLGDGQVKIEQDKPVELPLDMTAAQSKFNHTVLITMFPYLPTVAG